MKRKAAVFTIIQDEQKRFPVWYAHYHKHFRAADIFVLNHDSADDTFFYDPECHVVPVHNADSFSHSWLREVVQDFQKFLLNSYRCVLFCEIDELVVAEQGLSSMIDAFLALGNKAAARCRGVEIVERDGKPSYEASHWYDKTLIARIPALWSPGFHNANIQPPEPWPGLWLVHTHRQNYSACRAKHRETAARKWSQKDIEIGAGAHNRIQTDEEFNAWFYRSDGPKIELPESVLRQLGK